LKTLKDKKIRFLTVKLSSLKNELDLAQEIFRNAETEIEEIFRDKYFPERPTESEKSRELSTERAEEPRVEFTEAPPDPLAEDSESASNLNKDPSLRKMFKSIATKTHPDLLNEESELEKERKSNLFIAAKQAYEDEDFSNLIRISKELGIDLPELPPEVIHKMEQEVITINKELTMIHSTYVWQWVFSPNKEQRDHTLQELFKRMHEYIRA
jgi:hypothetical protein